jgi:hypothetical protein
MPEKTSISFDMTTSVKRVRSRSGKSALDQLRSLARRDNPHAEQCLSLEQAGLFRHEGVGPPSVCPFYVLLVSDVAPDLLVAFALRDPPKPP